MRNHGIRRCQEKHECLLFDAMRAIGRAGSAMSYVEVPQEIRRQGLSDREMELMLPLLPPYNGFINAKGMIEIRNRIKSWKADGTIVEVADGIWCPNPKVVRGDGNGIV